MKTRKRKIAAVITVWLIVIVLTACVISSAMTYLSLSERSGKQTMKLVSRNVEDVSNDVGEMADLTLMSYVDQFISGNFIISANTEDPEKLSQTLRETYSGKGVEGNVINTDGIIVASSVPEYIGYDMHYGEQAAEFLVLLDGNVEQYIQDIRGVSYDESVMMKYAGRRFSDGSGFLEIGIIDEIYYRTIGEYASFAATNRRIGENGYLLVCDKSLAIMNSYHNMYTGKTLRSRASVLTVRRSITMKA